MFDAGDIMKLVTFKRTVCPNDYNRILEGDLKKTSIIITTVEEAMEKTSEIRNEEKQTSSDKREMKPIMQLI